MPVIKLCDDVKIIRCSIHIVTRDRPESLALLLTSLIFQTYKNWDMVILDNSRNTKINNYYLIRTIINRLQLEGHRFHVIENNDEHRDIGKYRNQVIEADPFKNNIGIRIDDDSICEPNYIEILMNGFTDNKIGIVGGIVPYLFYPKTYILQPEKFNEIPSFFVPWTDHCTNFVRFIDNDGKDLHYKKTYFESGHIRSSYAYRIDLAKKIRFHEWSGPTGYTEETVFCIKTWLNGYKVIINPNAVCWHTAYIVGGGRDKISGQEQMNQIKKNNEERMQTELDIYRKTLGIKERGYP